MMTTPMKKVLAGVLVLLVAVAVLFAIVDVAPYLPQKPGQLPDGPAPLTGDKREISLDQDRQPPDVDGLPGVVEPGDLAVSPPADQSEGRSVSESTAATSAVETPEATPATSGPAPPEEPPAVAGTGEQTVKNAIPGQSEVFGLLTDTGETEENQIIDPQAAQTAMVAPGQKAPRVKIPAARQRVKGVAEHHITVVPEGAYPFAVLLETFDKQASAERAVVLHRRHNLACYWVKVDLGGPGVKYRLFTGSFPSRAAAQAAIARHRLTGKPVKRTMYAARIGIYRDNQALAAAFARTAAAGVSPYILGTAKGHYFLYVGAFYSAGGAENQCRDLTALGLPCQPVPRATLPAVP